MYRLNKYICVLCLLSVILCLSGCRPKGILHSWEMRSLLVDLHKADAVLQLSGVDRSSPEVKAIYYSQVLEKHHVTQATFDSSLVWYTAHPQLFDKIYPKVMKQLQKEEEQFLTMHESELQLLPDIRMLPSTPPAEPFTHAQLDSVLWVTQHGIPNTWNPLVHNFENEFFPQIGVLR